MWIKLFMVIVALKCVATNDDDPYDTSHIQPSYHSTNFPSSSQIQDTLKKAIKNSPYAEDIMHFLSTAGLNLAKYFQGDPDAQKKVKSDLELLAQLIKSPMMMQINEKLKTIGIDLNKLLKFVQVQAETFKKSPPRDKVYQYTYEV